MSYVRTGETAEGLYIWGDGSGQLTFCHDNGMVHSSPCGEFLAILDSFIVADRDGELEFDDGYSLEYGGSSLRFGWRGSLMGWHYRHTLWPVGVTVFATHATWFYIFHKNRWRLEDAVPLSPSRSEAV